MCDVCTVEVPDRTSVLQSPGKLHNISRSGGESWRRKLNACGYTSGFSLQTVPGGNGGAGGRGALGLMLRLID